MTVILAFGTSTTYGAWDIEGGWVQRLRRYLDEKQLTDPELYYLVYNLGISGDTSEDILQRLGSDTKPRIKQLDEGEDLIIILSCGINDSKHDNKLNKNKIPLEKYSDNIKKIIKVAKTYTPKVIFVGNKPVDDSRVNPIPWRPGHSYRSDLVEMYDSEASRICKQNNVPFCDVYNLFQKEKKYESLLQDGVHPTSKGHEVIYNIVKNFLIKNKII